MIKPLTIGSLTFPINLVQGPLAGVSCAPFRRITWQYGKPAFSYTEMLSCKALLFQGKMSQKRYIAIDPKEGPVCFQLASNVPHELAEATKLVTEYGANLVDLNCGCPVRKIRKSGTGSRLLADPALLYQLIRAMKDNTSIPVSVKIRIDGGSKERFNAEIAQAISDAGADFITVHGRHWSERYNKACHYDQIQFFVETLKIPVLGNGDVACLDSLKKMFSTGCAGVMIARAGVGQPWLIPKLCAEMKGEPFQTPNLSEIGTIFIDHITDMLTLFENEKFAIFYARQLCKYYARGLRKKADFCAGMNQCVTFEHFKLLCETWFKP